MLSDAQPWEMGISQVIERGAVIVRAEDRRRRQSGNGGFCSGSALENLRQLVVMRNVAAAAQIATILVVDRGVGIALPLVPMTAAVAFLLAFNYFTWRRVQRGAGISEREVMLQLLVDVGVLTLQLGLSGGATNPFVGIYLVPLTIVSAWLPRRYSWSFAAITLALFTLLLFVYRPLLPPGSEDRLLELVVIGRWASFAIIAAMIAHFVVAIASSLRAGEALLERARHREAIQEQVVRIGALAAGTAHELSTPLATMTLVVEELRERYAQDPGLLHPLSSLQQQLRACRGTLAGLLEYGDRAFARDGTTLPADEFLQRTLAAFRERRPDVSVHFAVKTGGTPPPLPNDVALGHAISNLLSNAADASAEAIDTSLEWDEETVRIVVRDYGPGIAPEVAQHLGTMFYTTKGPGKGTGLGLSLANLAVMRLGGKLSLGNADRSGVAAIVELPKTSMAPLDIDLMEKRVSAGRSDIKGHSR